MNQAVSLVRHASRIYHDKASKKYPGITRKGLAGLMKLARRQSGKRGIRAIKVSHVGYPSLRNR